MSKEQEEESKIVEQEVRNKDGDVVGKVSYDGANVTTEGDVRAQHVEGAKIAWAEKYKTHLELIEETDAKCTKCGGKQALYRHSFENDVERRTEYYTIIKCSLCGNSMSVHGSEATVPYK